jgi:hypothetical protein
MPVLVKCQDTKSSIICEDNGIASIRLASTGQNVWFTNSSSHVLVIGSMSSLTLVRILCPFGVITFFEWLLGTHSSSQMLIEVPCPTLHICPFLSGSCTFVLRFCSLVATFSQIGSWERVLVTWRCVATCNWCALPAWCPVFALANCNVEFKIHKLLTLCDFKL